MHVLEWGIFRIFLTNFLLLFYFIFIIIGFLFYFYVYVFVFTQLKLGIYPHPTVHPLLKLWCIVLGGRLVKMNLVNVVNATYSLPTLLSFYKSCCTHNICYICSVEWSFFIASMPISLNLTPLPLPLPLPLHPSLPPSLPPSLSPSLSLSLNYSSLQLFSSKL